MLRKLIFVLCALLLQVAMGSDDQLGITGQTQKKNEGANLTTFTNAATDTRKAAVDCSAEIYAALTSSNFGTEDREELAYFLHMNRSATECDTPLPNGTRSVLKSQIEKAIKFGDALGCRLVFFLDGRAVLVKQDELEARSDSKYIAFQAGVRAKGEAQELLKSAAAVSMSMPGAAEQVAELIDRAKQKAKTASDLFSKSFFRHESITRYVIF